MALSRWSAAPKEAVRVLPERAARSAELWETGKGLSLAFDHSAAVDDSRTGHTVGACLVRDAWKPKVHLGREFVDLGYFLRYAQATYSYWERISGLTMSQARGISAAGRADLARVTRAAGRVVTPEEVADILDIDRVDAAKKLARWTNDGWFRRARRGLYIPVPVEVEHPSAWSEDPLVLADAVWEPCYFTGWTSANHWGLTEQIFRSTVVKTAARVRRSRERLLEHEYVLTHVSEKTMAWGLATAWRHEHRLRMADPARTIIDVLDEPRLGGGIRLAAEMITAYLEEHPPETLVEYGDRLGNRTVFKRLGLLVEELRLGHERLAEACRERLSTGVSLLDPSAPDRGERASEWNLRVNVRVQAAGPS